MITPFQGKIIPINLFKRVGVQIRSFTFILGQKGVHLTHYTPPWIRAWGRPLLKYCSYLTCIFILMFQPLLLYQNCNIVPNLHAYNFPSNCFVFLTCFMFLLLTIVPNSCKVWTTIFAQCAYVCLHFLFLT